MPTLLGPAMLVLSIGTLVGSMTMLVTRAAGHDWSTDGWRLMRRATLVHAVSLGVGSGVAAILVSLDGPPTVYWALPVGAFVVALMVAVGVVAWRRRPFDPATREPRDDDAARARLAVGVGVSVGAAGLVLVALGIASPWAFGLGLGLALVLVAVLFVVLVRFDWPAAAFRRRAEARRDG
ncbi:hypothetical protein [Agrococcus jejuensis]|uniref:Uncharacterized protein n=1 Tax=Agrococcus jejuensis TaxID=399736 RepID=A0A1G8A2M0_9MICO|nr:hypothetical protein [Agrococcus jejuensis]SDH14670.1 hypothetical protein SAMN04489720_0205 [Agrococcus jejuensis]